MRILAGRLNETQKAQLRAETHGKWNILPHAAENMALRNISRDQAAKCLTTGNLVQFQREDDGSRRLLLRAQDGTCLVLDIDRKNIITIYHNNPNDNHQTLDRRQYFWGIVNDRMLK